MLETLIDRLGDPMVLCLAGLITGLVFGAAAQHSRFCLRAATVEVFGRSFGVAMGIWLIAFGAAVFATQALVTGGWLDVSGARQLAATGSLSGAIIGGLLFGAGMILARGCASRLLVLSGTGNMRALITGLVLTLVAQASYRGVLSPLRENLALLWTVEGGATRNLLSSFGIPSVIAAAAAFLLLVFGVVLVLREGARATRAVAAAFVGFAVAGGWAATYAISQVSFEPIAISSVTFTGPSTDTLMSLVNDRALVPTFSIGLVPGVFVGAALMALATGSFKLEQFDGSVRLERYMVGAVLMGFGSMLAGGCAVGAGVSGGAIFAVTAWVALFFMWIGALVMQALLALPGRTEARPGLA